MPSSFNRQAQLAPGHRFYSSPATLKFMAKTDAINDSSYPSRGRKVTRPLMPGAWTTCGHPKAKAAPTRKKPTEFWLGRRRVRYPSTITGDPIALPSIGREHLRAEADRVAKVVARHAADRDLPTLEIRYRGGLPALNWLAGQDAPLAQTAARAIARGASLGHLDNRIEHDAPDRMATFATMCESEPESVEPLVDALHEIKPGIHVLCREAGGIAWPWCGQRVVRNGKPCWRGEPWRYRWTEKPEAKGGDVIVLGNLQFYCRPESRRRAEGGLLVRYGKQRPQYCTDKPRGGKRSLRDDPTLYLSQRSTPSPMTVSPAAWLVTARSAGGNAVVARGATFLGGIVMGSATSSQPALPIDEETVELTPALEEAAAGGTLADIGEAVRDKSKPAPTRLDRLGKRALLAEARILVAANDNFSRRAAA